MSLDEQLRDVLAEVADRQVPRPVPVADVVERARLRRAGRRRARNRLVPASVALVAMLLVGGLLLWSGPAPRGRVSPAPPVPDPGELFGDVSYCLPPASPTGQSILHVDGEDVPFDCVERWHGATLWYHAGVTVLQTVGGGVDLLDHHGARPLGRIDTGGLMSISDDGRHVLWPTTAGLMVEDLTDGRPAGRVAWPSHAHPASPTADTWILGTDRHDRAYVGIEGTPWTYDIGTGSWVRLRGVGNLRRALYVTPDGLALSMVGGDAPVSVEGRVTSDGRFVQQRVVPLGMSAWSPARSRVLTGTPRELSVRVADDLGTRVRLHLGPRERALLRNGWWDAQWPSEGAVLVALHGTVPVGPGDRQVDTVLNCSAVTGSCRAFDGIQLARSPGAPVLG